jgi:hypothetical protein
MAFEWAGCEVKGGRRRVGKPEADCWLVIC